MDSLIHDLQSSTVNGHSKNGLNGSKNGVHDSRSLIEDTIMNLTPLWGYEEPPEMEWVVDQFLPKGYPTILAADGGIGKSFLSLHLATCVALGRPFLGLPVMRGNVLYLDFELQAVDQQRRLMKVLRGLGLDQHSPEITDRLFHLSPSSSLSDDHLHDKIGEVVRFYEIDLIVLDSLSFSLGGDASDQETVINAFRKMSSWNTTTLCVDHIAASDLTPVFWTVD